MSNRSPVAPLLSTAVLVGFSLGWASCSGPLEPLEWEAVDPPPPVIRRLTQAQYHNSIRSLLGPDVVLPSQLEPDAPVNDMIEIGSAVTALSSRGVEQYEKAAYSLAEQAMDLETVRASIVPCTPEATVDTACARQAIETLGPRVWRRPLTEEELTVLVDLATTAAEILEQFDDGLEYAIAALLQSPHFLYRTELGEPDPDRPGRYRYTNYEMATRLAYFLWNTTPDDALLEAAGRGELTDDVLLRSQVEDMLMSEQARDGIEAFFNDLYGLYRLDALDQDPTLFTHMSAEVGPSAAQETQRLLEALIFDENADIREVMTSRRAFLNRTLAAIYNVPAPDRDGFGETMLPEDGIRLGLLGQVSFLALNAHPVSTSATLRGMFVRETLLCQTIPPPPSGVDTSIPEPSGEAPTLRDRVAEHLEVEYCATCHQLTDPIGLAFENFDALGRYRATDSGSVIDASGEFYEEPFAHGAEVSALIAERPEFTDCLVEQLHRYATGHEVTAGEEAAIDWLALSFDDTDFRVRSLLVEITTSPAFRQTTLPE